MKKILITGGLGHIGSKLMKNLKSYNITILDNMSTQRYCSLFRKLKNIEFIEGDFSTVTIDFLNNFDIVIHLAAITDAASSFENEEKVKTVNTIQTKLFIDKVEKSEVDLFIFPSSTSVYGVADCIVHEDDRSFLNPQSPYAESKIEVENHLLTKKNNYVILRLGTIFGTSSGMRFHTAINKFCYQAAYGQPLTVWKENYEQKRPYLGLDDLVSAIRIIIKNKKSWNKTYNVLTDNYALKDVVNIIKKVADAKINFVNTPLINQYNYEVSQNKIVELGFKPKHDLEKEIIKTLKLLGK